MLNRKCLNICASCGIIEIHPPWLLFSEGESWYTCSDVLGEIPKDCFFNRMRNNYYNQRGHSYEQFNF